MILDTSFLIDVLRGDESASGWAERLEEDAFGAVTPVTVMELWEGIHLGESTESERAAVESLLEGLHNVDFDQPAAMTAGEINATLTREGDAVEVEDVIIGAIALVRDDPVLTRNVEDFERIPGLTVESY